jgi:hypothetical protein
MSRRTLMTILVVALVPIFLIAWYWIVLARPVLVGVDHHDFGFVAVEGSYSTVRHTFRLTNRSRKTLLINDVRTSCGCTTADNLAGHEVSPGQEIQLAAKLNLNRSGRRTESIFVEVDGRGVRTLTVTAVGRRSERLHTRQGEVTLISDRPTLLTVFADQWEDAPLEAPVIVTPDGVRHELRSWRLQSPANERRGEPARWVGQIALELVDHDIELPEDAAITVSLDAEQSLRVALRH